MSQRLVPRIAFTVSQCKEGRQRKDERASERSTAGRDVGLWSKVGGDRGRIGTEERGLTLSFRFQRDVTLSPARGPTVVKASAWDLYGFLSPGMTSSRLSVNHRPLPRRPPSDDHNAPQIPLPPPPLHHRSRNTPPGIPLGNQHLQHRPQRRT